jgi:hypothetical protein
MATRKQWFLKNNTRNSLQIGDLPKVPPVDRGKSVDLLRYYSEDTVSQSVNLKQILDTSFGTLTKKEDSSSSSMTTTDVVNQGIILIPGPIGTTGPQGPQGPAGPGTTYYVDNYDLVADGTTDNTAALKTLLETAYSDGGGIIEFGLGTYRFDGRIVIPNSATAIGSTRPKNKSMTFRGQGCGKTGYAFDTPLAATTISLYSVPITFANGSWDKDLWRMTSASLSSYVFYPGDLLQITDGVGINKGYFRITGKPTSTSVTLDSTLDVLNSPAANVENVTANVVQPAKIMTRGDGFLGFEGIQFVNGASAYGNFIHTTNTTLHVQNCSFSGYHTAVYADNADDCIILGAEATSRVSTAIWDNTDHSLTDPAFVHIHWNNNVDNDQITITGGTGTLSASTNYPITGKSPTDPTKIFTGQAGGRYLSTAAATGDITGAFAPPQVDTDICPFQGYGTVIRDCWTNYTRRFVYGRTYCNAVHIINNTTWWQCGGSACMEFESFYTDTDAGNYIAGNLIEVGYYTTFLKLKRSTQNVIIGNQLFDSSTITSWHDLDSTSLNNFIIPGFLASGTIPMLASGTGKVSRGYNTILYNLLGSETTKIAPVLIPEAGILLNGTNSIITAPYNNTIMKMPQSTLSSLAAGATVTVADGLNKIKKDGGGNWSALASPPTTGMHVFWDTASANEYRVIASVVTDTITIIGDPLTPGTSKTVSWGGITSIIRSYGNGGLVIGPATTTTAAYPFQLVNGTTTVHISGQTPALGGGMTLSPTVSTTGASALRIGQSITEGLELNVLEQTVTIEASVANFPLTGTLPANIMVIGAQATLKEAITCEGACVRLGIGIDGVSPSTAPSKYGLSDAAAGGVLAANSKINGLITPVVTSSEQISIWACDNGGAKAGTFVGDGSSQIRVRIYYYSLNGLDN